MDSRIRKEERSIFIYSFMKLMLASEMEKVVCTFLLFVLLSQRGVWLDASS